MPSRVDANVPPPGGGPIRRSRRHRSPPSLLLRRSSRAGDSDVPRLPARDLEDNDIEADDDIEAAVALHSLRAMADAAGALASMAVAADPPAADPPGEYDVPLFAHFCARSLTSPASISQPKRKQGDQRKVRKGDTGRRQG